MTKSRETETQRSASSVDRKEEAKNRIRQGAFISSEEFDELPCNNQWLVNGILLSGQPGVLGGPPKSLKTSLMLDMAISIGTGTPFLGKFKVPAQQTVAVISGESGKAVLRETARRICESKGVELDRDCKVHWRFKLPKLTEEADLKQLRIDLKKAKAKVVFIDPLYLCLIGGSKMVSASNLFEVGPVLLDAAKACLSAGATPIFLHHSKKLPDKKSDQLDLSDLAFAGIAEFCRQWLLVRRREQYVAGSGLHHLALSVGGSAGHSGCWSVDIKEGRQNESLDGREWDVSVKSASGEQSSTKTTKTSQKSFTGYHSRQRNC